MRFMIIRKADRNTEAGVFHDAALPATRLEPSATGSRVKFTGGKATVVDGPFADGSDLIAGFTFIEAGSRQEAIEWVKASPELRGAGDVEIEIREGGCPGGLPGVVQAKPSGSARPKQFVILLKSDSSAETGFIPDAKVLDAMGKWNDDAVAAGVMLAGEGLQPSARGARVKFSKGKPSVVDGPFTEAKELVAGFWLIQVSSKDDAIEWVKNYPYPIAGEGEVEIRQVLQA